MVESKFCLLQVQFKFTFFNSVKFHQTMLCKAPKRLNSVDVLWTSNKLIISMIDPKVLINTNVNQAVIASPSIGVNDAVGVHFPSDDGLQRRFGSVWNNFRVNTDPSFEKTKNDSLSTSPSASFTSDSFGSKVGLTSFNFTAKWRTICRNLASLIFERR